MLYAMFILQAYFRGYRVRKTFTERKKLLMKHDQLRKEAARYTLSLSSYILSAILI